MEVKEVLQLIGEANEDHMTLDIQGDNPQIIIASEKPIFFFFRQFPLHQIGILL